MLPPGTSQLSENFLYYMNSYLYLYPSTRFPLARCEEQRGLLP